VRLDQVFDRGGADRGVEFPVRERQLRVTVEVVHDMRGQARVLSHLFGVEAETGDIEVDFRQMRHPTAHEVEHAHAGFENARIYLVMCPRAVASRCCTRRDWALAPTSLYDARGYFRPLTCLSSQASNWSSS